jgi:hypothetical protein
MRSRLFRIREELGIADAKVRQAAAAASVIAARAAKLSIRTPQDGALGLLVAEPVRGDRP